MSNITIGKYIREWEEKHKEVLPRRGTIHDIGPTLTHKKMIIEKLFLEQKSVETASRETCHSYEAIQRYISAFRQLLLSKKKGMNQEEIAYAVGKTRRLVKEYEDLIDEFRKKNYVLDNLLNEEPKVSPSWKITWENLEAGQTPV